MKGVMKLVAEKSDWAKKKSGAGHGFGIAVHRSFLSYIAVVVEVEVDAKGKVKIPRVDYAVDAGLVVHPDRVKAQFEGAAVEQGGQWIALGQASDLLFAPVTLGAGHR